MRLAGLATSRSASAPVLVEIGTRAVTVSSFHDLLSTAASYSVDTVWIHRSSLRALGIPLSDSPGKWPTDYPSVQENLSRYGSFTVGDMAVSVGIPAFDEGSPLQDLSADRLLEVVTRVERALGIPYSWSPRVTGQRLMAREFPRSTIGSSSESPPPPARIASTEVDMGYLRPIGSREGDWILQLDQKSRYVTSCSSAYLGNGDASHLPDPDLEDLRDGERLRAGYYLVDLAPIHSDLLDPFGGSGPRWITAPSLELALQLGISKSVLEAYVYPAEGRYLRGWYESLRKALLEVEALGDREARTLIKNVGNFSIGALHASFRNPGDRYYRPDWRHTIVGLSRANTYRGIQKLQRGIPELGSPVAVYSDAVFFAVDFDVIRDLEQHSPESLGHWKVVGSSLRDRRRTNLRLSDLQELTEGVSV